MKRLLSITGGLLGLLALGALAVTLALTFGGLRRDVKPASQAFQSPIETPTQPPYPPPATPTPPGPLATPTVAPTPVPRCTFAARPAPAEPATPLEAYQFSEPRVVLTHTSAIGIAGWLPDGQRLLITKEIPGTNRQAIEIFNTRTRGEFVYAERHSLTSPPVWLASQESVGFIDSTLEEGDALRLSHNRGGPVETLRTQLASSYLAVDSGGEKVAFLLQDQGARPAVMDLLGRGVQLFNVELPLSSIKTFESIYHAAWRPRGNEVAFYNDSGLYLLDTVSGQACQVALGLAGLGERGPRWAYLAKWSPNGRYLAMITTSGRFPLEFSELTILDTSTGELRSVHPSQVNKSVQYYVTGISWSADSGTLAIESVIERKEGTDWAGLFLVDARTGNFKRILPDFLFGGGEWGQNLAWSPVDKRLAVACPGDVKASLCLITISSNP